MITLLIRNDLGRCIIEYSSSNVVSTRCPAHYRRRVTAQWNLHKSMDRTRWADFVASSFIWHNTAWLFLRRTLKKTLYIKKCWPRKIMKQRIIAACATINPQVLRSASGIEW